MKEGGNLEGGVGEGVVMEVVIDDRLVNSGARDFGEGC